MPGPSGEWGGKAGGITEERGADKGMLRIGRDVSGQCMGKYLLSSHRNHDEDLLPKDGQRNGGRRPRSRLPALLAIGCAHKGCSATPGGAQDCQTGPRIGPAG